MQPTAMCSQYGHLRGTRWVWSQGQMGVVIMEVGGWVNMQVYKVYKSSWWLHWMSIEWTETTSLRCSAAES